MAEKLLKLTIEKNPFLEAILITDKEGVDIFTAYKNDAPSQPLKESQAGIVFVAAFVQANDHLIKLNQGKCKSILLFYDNYLVYQEFWDLAVFTVFSAPDGNAGKIFEIAEELKNKFKDLSSVLVQTSK